MNGPEHSTFDSGSAAFPDKLTQELEKSKHSATPQDMLSASKELPEPFAMIEAAQTPEQLKQTEIKFVNVEHTNQNIPQILDAVKDSDIVALESVGGHPVRRTWREEQMNQALQPDAEDTFAKLPDELELENSLVDKFQKSGKRVVLIDVDKTAPEYRLVEEELKLEEKKLEVFFGQSIAAVKQYERELIQLRAKVDTAREQVITRQLQKLVGSLDKPAKIAVIQGAAHSATFHAMEKHDKTILATREIVPKSGPDFVFDPTNEAARLLKHFPDKQLPEELLNRVVLEEYFEMFVANQNMSLAEIAEQLRAKADREVSTILARIDKVLRSPLRPIPRLKYRKIRAIVQKAFVA